MAEIPSEVRSTETSELPSGQSRRLRLRNTTAMLQPSKCLWHFGNGDRRIMNLIFSPPVYFREPGRNTTTSTCHPERSEESPQQQKSSRTLFGTSQPPLVISTKGTECPRGEISSGDVNLQPKGTPSVKNHTNSEL